MIRWPWNKQEEKEDRSWEALSQSEKSLQEARDRWPDVQRLTIEAKRLAFETRFKREQNHFPELLHNILYGGK